MLNDDDLSDFERTVCDAVASRSPVDGRVGKPEDDDPASGASWGAERTVRAELLVELLSGERRPGAEASPRRLDLSGVRITGTLDLEALTVAHPIALVGCSFEAPVSLDESNIPRVDLSGSHLPALSGRQLMTRGDLILRGLTAQAGVDLVGARIGGSLRLSGAHLTNSEGAALDADAVRVEQDVFFLEGFTSHGEVRLVGAHIGGQLIFSGAQIANPDGAALTADGIQVEQDMFCRDGFAAQGEVRLPGGHIGGQVDLAGAQLTNPGGHALNADGLRVDQAMFCRFGFSAQGEVRLPGGHVGGQLDLSGAHFSNPGGSALGAARLRVDQSVVCRDGFTALGEVSLVGAHVGGQHLSGAQLTNPDGRTLIADGLRIEQDMFCRDGFASQGEVRMLGAQIGGQLDLSSAQLTNSSGPALTAARLRVHQDIFCRDGFAAQGEVSLLGAHIGGQMDLTGARFANPDGPALIADRLEAGQDVFCRNGFEAHGEVRMLGASIGGQLALSGAHLSNPAGSALTGVRLHVHQDVFCRDGFTARGQVNLFGAQVGGQLNLVGAELDNPTGLALDLESAEAAELWLPGEPLLDGTVDLTDARVGQLHDVWRTSTSPDGEGVRHRPRLSGFVFESLGQGSDACEGRLDWLNHAEEGYLPHAYDQLADFYRRAGRDEDARRVAIAKQRRRRGDLPAPAKAMSYALDAAVGYGYRTWRAVYALFAIVLVGWGVFAWASWDHLHEMRADGQRPPFQPWLYSIDAVLPVINLGQESAWAATGAAQVWYAISVLAGWLLSLALIAVLTATLFRE